MHIETNNPKIDHTVRTFVRRSRRMTQLQCSSYQNLYTSWCINYSLLKSTFSTCDNAKNNTIKNADENLSNIINKDGTFDFFSLFGNNATITCEIGFGQGDATALIAKNNPCKNYLCIEVFQAGIANLLAKIESEKLTNIRIIEGDAIDILETIIPNESISAFHFFFPDPWQKKKHHKRRFLRRPRTDLLRNKLIAQGYIYMVTDWQDYAFDAFTEMSATDGLTSLYEGFAPHQEWRAQTKFELRAIKEGRQIYEMMFEKQAT